MKRTKDLKSPARRDFFRKAGLGLGAAGLASIGAAGSAGAETKVDHGFKKSQYRETEHVRQAYETAKF